MVISQRGCVVQWNGPANIARLGSSLQRGGVEGLKTSPIPGRPPFLTEPQVAELYELAVKGPDLARPKRTNPRLHLPRRHVVETNKYTTALHKGTESDGPDSLSPSQA
jgi:hypothetical protein